MEAKTIHPTTVADLLAERLVQPESLILNLLIQVKEGGEPLAGIPAGPGREERRYAQVSLISDSEEALQKIRDLVNNPHLYSLDQILWPFSGRTHLHGMNIRLTYNEEGPEQSDEYARLALMSNCEAALPVARERIHNYEPLRMELEELRAAAQAVIDNAPAVTGPLAELQRLLGKL